MEYKKKCFKKAVHFMKDSFEKFVEVHNELRFNVDEQQYDIRILNNKVA